MARLFHRLIAATLAALLLTGAVATAALARATGFTETIVIDLTGQVVDGCGEPVILSGSLRDTFHLTERVDGSSTWAVTTHPAGLFGTGLSSGSTYRAT